MRNDLRAETVSDTQASSHKTRSATPAVFLVGDITQCREFYLKALGCAETQSHETRIEFMLRGHHIACESRLAFGSPQSRPMLVKDCGNYDLPVFPNVQTLKAFAKRLNGHRQLFSTAPFVRFIDTRYDHAELVVTDPWGNSLVFKLIPHPNLGFKSRRLRWMYGALGAVIAIMLVSYIMFAELLDKSNGADLDAAPCSGFHPCVPWR